jgi:hypothetical protein
MAQFSKAEVESVTFLDGRLSVVWDDGRSIAVGGHCEQCMYWEEHPAWSKDEFTGQMSGTCTKKGQQESWDIEGGLKPKTVVLLADWGSGEEYPFDPPADFGCVYWEEDE